MLRDNNRGSVEGAFYSNELGKFSIKYSDKVKYFFISGNNDQELIDVRSTDKKIISYFNNFEEKSKKVSLFWANKGLPEIVKIYNDEYFKGKTWIGVLENKILKEDSFAKKNFFSWYFLISSLIAILFFTWYKERKN